MRRLDFDVNNKEVRWDVDVQWSEPNYVCLNGLPSLTLRLALKTTPPFYGCPFGAQLQVLILSWMLDLDLPYTSACEAVLGGLHIRSYHGTDESSIVLCLVWVPASLSSLHVLGFSKPAFLMLCKDPLL
jgi:hypothetical protein